MFFFPYHTDAPLYHYPIGTVLLIVINVLMFAATWSQDPQTYDSLILPFDTIQPTQWVTSAFMHVDIMHLAGNMLFLWSFGLIVEGKLGWYRFLPLYLGIAIDDAWFSWWCLGGIDRDLWIDCDWPGLGAAK